MLLPVDSVSTVMIFDTEDYTLKVAQSAVTKCWLMYRNILWRMGLLSNWSLLPEDVIRHLRRRGLVPSSLRNIQEWGPLLYSVSEYSE